MVKCLATAMSTTYTYMFTLPNSQDSDRSNYIKMCKVLGFQIRVLQMFVKEFQDQIGSGIRPVYQLILTLQSRVPPSFCAAGYPSAMVAEVERQVTVGVPVLIRTLIPCTQFAVCLTQNNQELERDHRLPWLLTVLAVLDNLSTTSDDVQTLWLVPVVHSEDIARTNILRTLFAAITLCHAELSAPVTLPGVMANGKPQRMVSLYEAVVTRVSGFLACTLPHHFHVAETTLLEMVLSQQHFPAMLAIDAWCFLARFGTADMCRDHCLQIAFLVHQGGLSSTPQCCHLVVLLRRLLRFMAPEHQNELIGRFPVATHPDLWCVVPLAVLVPKLQELVVQQLISMATGHIDQWIDAPQKTTAKTKLLVMGLRILQNVCASVGVTEHVVSEHQRTGLVTQCTRLWDMLPPDQMAVYPPLHAVATSLYHLSATLSLHLEDKITLQIILTSSRILSHDPPTATKLAILHFLSTITKKNFIPPEEAHVNVELPTLYRKLLLDTFVIVHQVALETFEQFAEETPHEGAVPATLQTDPRLQAAVVSYINQDKPLDMLLPVAELQRDAEQVLQMAAMPASTLYPTIMWPAAELSMQASKQLRCDTPGTNTAASETEGDIDMAYMCSLADLRRGLTSLTDVKRSHPLPDWLKEEVKDVHTRLGLLL